jgi:hypothetical protein
LHRSVFLEPAIRALSREKINLGALTYFHGMWWGAAKIKQFLVSGNNLFVRMAMSVRVNCGTNPVFAILLT